MSNVVLEVKNLTVNFQTEDGIVHAVDNVSYKVEKGKTLAIVGESGSGKSVSSLALMGLLNSSKATISGQVNFAGQELISADPEDVRKLRGLQMAMIFQDPLSALHPFYTIGAQLIEAVQVHNNISDKEARDRSRAMLERVGISSVDQRLDEYPHQLSGGMRQRVMIAMALINNPELLIADEPTTALDVTVQAQILDLLRDLQKEFGTAIVLITHDLGVVADMADDVMVMYGGSAVEQSPARELFYQPQMPYTWGLLGSIPQMNASAAELDSIPGMPPSLINLPKGCVFQPRCVHAAQVPGDLCKTARPDLVAVSDVHSARCHLSEQQRTSIRQERKIGKASS